MNSHVRTLWKPYALYTFCLIVPSIATIHKYGGKTGLIVYLLGAIVLIPLVLHVSLTSLVKRMTPKLAWLLAALCFVALITAFAVGYPYAQNHSAGGGSDADDALNVAAGELLQGRYLYYPRTYLNFPISPLPGAIFLAVPFYLLGSAAWQNVFWLIAYFFISLHTLRDVRWALIHFVTLLCFSPAVLHHYVIGSDLIANPIYVMASMQFLLFIRPEKRPFAGTACAILFGLALSSRFNFVFVAPSVFVLLWRQFGRGPAIRQSLIAVATFVAVTLPFYLYDPAGFSPLHAANKLRYFDQFYSAASMLVLILMALLSVGLAFRQKNSDERGLYANCAFIQAIPIVTCFFIEHARLDHLNSPFLYYGLFFTFFGSLVAVADVAKQSEPRP